MKKKVLFVLIILCVTLLIPTFSLAKESEDLKLAVGLIERTIKKEGYSFYCVSYDEAGIWVSVAEDGKAEMIASAKENGYSMESWEKSRESVLSVCESLYGFVHDTMDIKDKILGFYFLDDTDHSNIIIAAMGFGGESRIIYDALKDGDTAES